MLKLEPLLFSRRRTPRLQRFNLTSQVVDLPVASLKLSGDSRGVSPLVGRYQRYYQQFYHQNSQQADWQDRAGIAMLLPLGMYHGPAQFSSSLKKNSLQFLA